MNNTYYTITPQQEFQAKANSVSQIYNPTNQEIQSNSGINSNWDYREYMQKNANQIMKYNTMQSIYTSGNNPYTVLNTNPTNNTPHLYNSVHDNKNPLYGFRNSDLKQDYTKKEQIKSRMISPSIPTNF